MTQDQHKLEPCPFCGCAMPSDGGHADDCYFTVLASLKAAPPADLSLAPTVLAAWNRRAHLQQRPLPVREGTDETPAEEALRSLACWLGVGGYNAPTVDAKVFEAKIREGVTTYLPLHGMAARNLAELVLDMGMVTDKGIRARELARRVLGIVPPAASPSLPVREEPTPLSDEERDLLARVEATLAREWNGLHLHKFQTLREKLNAAHAVGGRKP